MSWRSWVASAGRGALSLGGSSDGSLFYSGRRTPSQLQRMDISLYMFVQLVGTVYHYSVSGTRHRTLNVMPRTNYKLIQFFEKSELTGRFPCTTVVNSRFLKAIYQCLPFPFASSVVTVEIGDHDQRLIFFSSFPIVLGVDSHFSLRYSPIDLIT